MDAIGAAIGVLKAVQVSQKEGFIVLEGINPSIEKLMEEIYGNEKMATMLHYTGASYANDECAHLGGRRGYT